MSAPEWWPGMARNAGPACSGMLARMNRNGGPASPESATQIKTVVEQLVFSPALKHASQVGPSYGRKFTGGINFSERIVVSVGVQVYASELP